MVKRRRSGQMAAGWSGVQKLRWRASSGRYQRTGNGAVVKRRRSGQTAEELVKRRRGGLHLTSGQTGKKTAVELSGRENGSEDGRMAIKQRSNDGQMAFDQRSNGGQAAIKQWVEQERARGRPTATAFDQRSNGVRQRSSCWTVKQRSNCH